MRTFHLFISHSWTHSDAYERLRGLLDNRSYFDYIDYSVPKDDPVHTNGTDAELEQAITNHMRPCQVIVVLAGVYASYSKWIDKEIAIAEAGFSNRKSILAIRPWGSERISRRVSDAADEVVAWNTDSIVAAIRRLG